MDNDQVGGENDGEPDVFKSRFYEEQATDLHHSRSKAKEHLEAVRRKKKEIWDAFSAQKDNGEADRPVMSWKKEPVAITLEEEVTNLIERYRSDSPVNNNSNLVSKIIAITHKT